tara:strand:- start:24194 stop:25003 length:810 start_codon:yes stop_codon:yes gene_type:complete
MLNEAETTTDLDLLAQEIAQAGSDEESVTRILAKGMADAIGSLTSLLKGKDTIDPEAMGGEDAGDGEEDETSNVTDDEDEDAGDGEDGAGGYQDMMMGRADYGDGFGGDGDTFDVTEHVLQTGNTIIGLAKGRKADNALLRKAMRQQSATHSLLKGINSKLDLFINAQIKVQVPLAKAVVDMHEALLDAPEAVSRVRAGGGGNRPRIPAKVANAAFIGGDERTQKIALLKARRNGIIDEGQKRMFWLENRFAVDETENASIRQRVVGVL